MRLLICDIGNPPQYNQTERPGDSMLDLGLDDPFNLPHTENPQAMSNMNKDDPREFVLQFPVLFQLVHKGTNKA